jgi:two-component system sensor histidine kinase KdpD
MDTATPTRLIAPAPRAAYGRAALACALVTLVAMPLRETLDLANIVMLYLLVVFLTAIRLGRGPAVLASLLGTGLFDFFFVPPHLTFAVTDAQYLLTFAVMIAVGLITAHLVSGIREQAQLKARGEEEARELYGMARALGSALSLDQVTDVTRRYLADTRGFEASLYLADKMEALRRVGAPGHGHGDLEAGFARSAYANGKVVEVDAFAGTGVAAAYFPLVTPTRIRGVLTVSPGDRDEDAFRAQQPLLGAVASLVALAVERIHYAEAVKDAELAIVAERLRSSVLSALSHDLRTPLTTLVGLADSLARSRSALTDGERESAAAIRDQSRAMSRMLGNLLDMARLQSGRVKLRREWQPLEEVVGAALRMLGNALADHPLTLNLPADLPLVAFDAVLMERVLGNLLENAAKYSPASAPVELSARVTDDTLTVSVCDRGRGFAPGALESAFELFNRGVPESITPGVGLGLAICKSIVEAHGGVIFAENREGTGACIRFTLPLGTPPAFEEEAE